MEIIDNGHLYYEAMKNVENFDITKLSFVQIFKKMQNDLVGAFDRVTTFDVRTHEQIKLVTCEAGYVVEKDFKTYPVLVLILKVMDWDSVKNSPDEFRKADFQLQLTPFRCELDKAGEMTGVYGGCDKELTKAWRKILKDKYPEYEQGLKRYAIDARDAKIEQAKREYENIINKADEEYNKEFNY